MTRSFPTPRRLPALLAGALALGLSLSACDADPTGAADAVPPAPGVVSGAVVDPAAVGSGATGDPSGGVSFAAGLPTETTNRDLARVAKAVAQVLADEEVRAYVHGRATNRFDGETNVLWRALERATDAPAAFGSRRGLAFSALLADRAAATLGSDLGTPGKINAAVTAASRALGGPMHLLWVDADRVGPSVAPLVTFTPLGMDPDAIEQILAYDADGREHIVNDEVAKSRPVVALSYNERVTEEDIAALEAGQTGAIGTTSAIKRGTSEFGGGVDPYATYFIEPCTGCGGGGGGGGETSYRAGSPDPVVSGQVRLEYIKLYYDYEGFTMGGPEIRLQVTSYNAQSETTDAEVVSNIWLSHHIDDSWVDGKKIHIDKNIMPWNTENNPTLSMKWTEVDDFSAIQTVCRTTSSRTPSSSSPTGPTRRSLSWTTSSRRPTTTRTSAMLT